MLKKLSPTSYFKNYLYDNPDIGKLKRKKVTINEFYVLSFKEYDMILSKNYNVSQLKTMARYYKLKISGNKKELIKRVWNFLKYSNYANKIQKLWRGYIVREYNVISKIKKCVNCTDFLSLTSISKIPIEQLFCFKDKDGFTYGFDAKSFNNLILKNKKPTNPYNRKELSNKTIQKFKKFVKYGKILGRNIILDISDDTTNLSLEKQIELKAHSIFQKIDQFGHITDTNWFLDLDRNQLKRLLHELVDIWNYRASLQPLTKIAICPPNGNPFGTINTHQLNSLTKAEFQIKLLSIFNKLLTSGIEQQSRALGAFYILGAITLVSQSAAVALPWLFESVYYNPTTHV